MKKILFALLIISTLALASCGGSGSSGTGIFSSIPDELQCTQDSDCVAAVCCHATQAVNKDNAPDCSGILCSANCEENTMDCGQAKAKCVENACTVVVI